MWYLIVGLFLFLNAEAKIIQILHTNDIHSQFKHTFFDPAVGGYARLKTIIEQEKQNAEQEGIPTILIDAGDFLEGGLFYIAQSGKASFKLHNSMGYDVVTLGNHDYLMGITALNQLLGEVKDQIDFTLLAANIDFNFEINDYIKSPGMMLASRDIVEHLSIYKYISTPTVTRNKFPFLNDMVKSSFIKKIDDLNICFIGVTSDEKYYKWKFLQEDVNIDDPILTAIQEAKALHKRKIPCHYTIALTHIPLEDDLKLAKKSKRIDLIIGGHSFDDHTLAHDIITLNDPKINSNKNNPPILKAGSSASFLGKILIDIDPHTHNNKIISHQLIPIKDVTPDPKVASLVDEAERDIKDEYTPFNLDEHLGYLEVGQNDNANFIWSSFIAESIRDITLSDAGINDSHMVNYLGNYIKGYFPLSRFDVWNSYPRFFEFENKYGWNIYVLKIHGIILKKIIKKYLKERSGITFAGVDFNTIKENGKIKIQDITVSGKLVDNFKKYTLAVPEGIFEGMKKHIKYTYDPFIPTLNISPHIDKIALRTNFTVFHAMETLLQKYPVVNACNFHAKSIHIIKSKDSPCNKKDRVYLMIDNTKAFSIRANYINYETLKKEQGNIDLHYYSIGYGEIAFTEFALLRKAARAGVKIRMVIDGLATYPNDENIDKKKGHHIKGILKHLVKEGVEIKTHHNPFTRPLKINNRNHNKILKLSQSIIIGDRNLRNENYDTIFNKNKKNIGLDIIVKGDQLREMDIYLEQFWKSNRLQEETFPSVSHISEQWGKDTLDQIEEEDSLSLFNLNPEEIDELYEQLDEEFINPNHLSWILDRDNTSKNIKINSLSGMNEIISAIYRAKKTIKIVSPYMVLTNRMKNALEYAISRGVEIEFVTNGYEDSILLLNDLMHAGYIKYRKKYCNMGLKMYEVARESGHAVHAKVVVIDEETVFISSNNWNHRSEKFNVEIGLRVDDREIANKILKWYQKLPVSLPSEASCTQTMKVIFYNLFKFFL